MSCQYTICFEQHSSTETYASDVSESVDTIGITRCAGKLLSGPRGDLSLRSQACERGCFEDSTGYENFLTIRNFVKDEVFGDDLTNMLLILVYIRGGTR